MQYLPNNFQIIILEERSDHDSVVQATKDKKGLESIQAFKGQKLKIIRIKP